MQVACYLLPGIILGIVNYKFLVKEKDVKTISKLVLAYLIDFNLVYLGFQRFYLNQKDILKPELYNWKFASIYILKALLVGGIYLIIKGILIKNNKIEFEKIATNSKNRKWEILLKTIAVIFVAIGAIFKDFADWFVGYFGNITPEQFFFNLKSSLKGTGGGMIEEIITNPVFAIITTTIMARVIISFSYNVYLYIDNKRYKLISKKIYNFIMIIFACLMMVSGVTYGSHKLQLKEIVKSYFAKSTYVEDNYVDPRDVQMTFPKHKRNLIHIYLESVENSYLSKDMGGYSDENLMPGLSEILKEGDSFSSNEQYGGPNQIYGSSWSIAGMVNMMAGIPLKIADYGKNGSFLPGIITIGDILEAEGYEQTIMFGSDIDFGGLSTYFKDHGNFNQFDLKVARDKGLIPKDYFVWWGFEDEKLYEYAKAEITRLSETGKPFNFTMETADTHFPDGWLSPNAPTPYEKQYANVIAFSDKQATDFINWCKEQPFYENTTIVLTGDHLSMDENFFKDWDPNYHRTIYNVILNSAEPDPELQRVQNRNYAPFDFYPTILASLGVQIKGDRLGLGTNLYSNKKTLIERDGLDYVNEQLSLNSQFYLDKFIDESGTSVFKTTNVKIRNNN